MKIGDRVQLKFLHKPTGTIIDIEDGTRMNDVVLVEPRFIVQWDDGESGKVSANDIIIVDERESNDNLLTFL